MPSRLDPETPSRYDDYVQTHMDAMMAQDPVNQYPGWAHMGPAFLPWHRYYLYQLESDLQGIDPKVDLPYWDWATDNSPNSSIWNPDFLGGNGRPSDGRVMDGPFAFDAGNWSLNIRDPGDDNVDLKRSFGTAVPSLPTVAQVADTLTVVPYYVAPWRAFDDFTADTPKPVQPSFCNRLEGWYGDGSLHNRVHVWVGGTMQGMTSPNDPVFFLNHCNIDRLWAQWQSLHPTEPYLPASGGPTGHNLNDPMKPWGGSITPASAFNHQALGYWYDTELPLVELEKASLEFKDVPEGMMGRGVTKYQAITFKVKSCAPVTLQVVSNPPAGFGLPSGGSMVAVQPSRCNWPAVGRLWVSYTSTVAGSKITGSMQVKAMETGQTWDVSLSANTVPMPKMAMERLLAPARRIIKFGLSPEDKAKMAKEHIS